MANVIMLTAISRKIVPIVYAKALIYRPPTLTNVYFNQAYQLNNYAVEGVTSG